MKTMCSKLPARKLLAATISMAAASSSLAVETLEEVSVVASPIRDSQQASIDAKRKADNVVDVIAADAIGRFPDQNLADSLGRVPGMAIERDQGQARYINFRGTPFRYTAIGFDGIDVPGAENGRIPRFDSFPSVITSKVEVNKAVLPSMPGEAVAGYVDIKTFNPFDREGFSLDTDLGIGEQDLGGGDIEKFSLRTSWSDENWGIMVFGSKNCREQITDNIEYELELVSNQTLVNELQKRSYKIEREDEALGGHLEYRNEEGALRRVFVSTLNSEFVDREQRTHYQFNFVAAEPGNSASDSPLYIDRLLQYGQYDNSTNTSTLGGDFKLADWTIEARYNVTETEFNTRLPILYSSGVNFVTRSPSITLGDYDISDIEDPIVTLAAPLSSYEYAALYGYKVDWPLNVEADKFKLDAKHEFSFGELRLGLQFDRREVTGAKTTDFDIFAFDPDVTFQAEGAADPLNIQDFATSERWYSNSTNSIGATYFDNIGLRKAWQAYGEILPEAGDGDLVSIDEDISAAYAMVSRDFDWGNVIYGLRIEQTDYSSAGAVDGNSVVVSDDFTHVLPSIHINVDLAENVKARLSASSGVNRPTYVEWRAAASIDPINGTVEGGNPTLEAEESWGVDASVEYYFAPSSILSAGVFYRNVDNVIYEDVSSIDAGIYGNEFAGQEWELEGYVNGSDGQIHGLEFNFIGHAADITEALDGFGLSFNMTVLDSEFTHRDGTKTNLPGTSDLTYNASLFYEKYGLSIRLNYQYRDEWISPLEDPEETWAEQERLDMSIQYTLPVDWEGANITIYANANNLTDETDVRYAGNGTVNQTESYGSRYLAGIRLSF